jgi:hypothetical protein
MTFETFITTYLGKKVDWDGAYAGQCVDLFRQYVNDVLGLQQPKGVVGAKDFWTNYETDPILKENFTKILNTPEGIPLKGDVMIWDAWTSNPYGHIAIFIEGDGMEFVSLDQNFPSLSIVTKTVHNYTKPKVIGWLRPKIMNLFDPEKDLPTWLESQYDLKGYSWYNNKWNFPDFIEFTDDKVTENKEFLKEIEKLRIESQKLREQNASLSNSISELAGKNVSLENQLQNKKNELESLAMINGLLTQENTTQNLEITELENKLNGYLEELHLGDFIKWIGFKLGIK